MESNVLYIEPTMKDIVMYRKLIKSQGNDVCQNEIDIYTINETIHSFTFGFIIISTKAQIGRRNLNKNDLFLIDGFIFCSHNNITPKELHIELVCSRKEKHVGKRLMNHVEERAKQYGISQLTLHCLADDKLRKWYESLGFLYVRTINLNINVPKVFYMCKNIKE
jgi:N-acetylglutamate synthase-like GNAT family acetyltransferase